MRLMAFLLGLGVLAGVAGATPLDDLELPPVEKQPWRFEGFPILAWWGPPGTATLKDFENYRDAGFTIYLANPDEGFYQALDYAREADLSIMTFRDKAAFALKDLKNPMYPADDPRVVGWLTNDEPQGYPAVIASITAVNKLMRDDPTRWALFNFLPPFAMNNPDPREGIDAAIRHGMPILSYDLYAIFENGDTNEQGHYDALKLFRQASLDHNVPFWAFALSIKHFHYRRASESDLRWNHFTNLAYGAKGLWYFTYWGPTDWENWDTKAIVNPADGSKSEIYPYVSDINHAVLAMGDTLLKLRSERVVHTNTVKGQNTFRPHRDWIDRIKAKNAMIGFFRHEDGSHYAMVVNKEHGKEKSAAEMADDVVLTFAPEVEAVTAVNWLDGKPGPLALKDQSATLRIAGGTGVLLKAEVDESALERRVEEEIEPVWFWTDEAEASKEAPAGSRYFARPLNLEREVAHASIRFWADDNAELFVDGESLGTVSYGDAAASVTLTQELAPGQHVLAIRAGNTVGPAGVVFSMTLTMKNGRERTVTGDSRWRWTAEQPEGWPKAAPRGEEWKPVRTLGRGAVQPWESLGW